MTKRLDATQTLSNFVSVTQFAKLKGVTPQAVRKAIKEKRIWAEKVGCQWIVGRGQALKCDEGGEVEK